MIDHTFVPALSIAPRQRIATISSFFHIGQFNGSFGSSLGCGESTMCAFLPVPCFRVEVIFSTSAAWSLSSTVPGTCVSLLSGCALAWIFSETTEGLPSRTPRPILTRIGSSARCSKNDGWHRNRSADDKKVGQSSRSNTGDLQVHLGQEKEKSLSINTKRRLTPRSSSAASCNVTLPILWQSALNSPTVQCSASSKL